MLNLANRGHTAPGQRADLLRREIHRGQRLYAWAGSLRAARTEVTTWQWLNRTGREPANLRRPAVPVDRPVPSLDGFAEPLRRVRPLARGYTVEARPAVRKALRRLSADARKDILAAMRGLAMTRARRACAHFRATGLTLGCGQATTT